jgi:hypothetical protein
MDDKKVTISMQHGMPVPDKDPIEVEKDNQKVKWEAGFEFKITVEDYDDIKYSQSGSTYQAKSGAFGTIKQYKYTISANGVDNDPTIDVKPAP